MPLEELINTVSEVKEQSVFVHFSPNVLDFTDNESPKDLHIHLQDGRSLIIPLEENLFFLISILKSSLFSKGMKILCWDWKTIASFILSRTGKDYFVGGFILDLKVIESYLGIKDKPPKGIKEALLRLKRVMRDGSWKSIEGIYKKLHIPLMTTVIPHLENSGVVYTSNGYRAFANYDIDGQENGRLLCSGAFKKGFIPHAMGPEARSSIKPNNLDDYFMSFDFRAMEVFMLAWLSKDPSLLEACGSQDVYLSLYEKITGKPSGNKSDRGFVKKCFLPVIYGQSSYNLGRRCGIPKDTADSIIDRINSLFPIAAIWVQSQEQQLKVLGFATDPFGKRRFFEEGKEYLVRNFCVQSPAAVVCLEKLCNLFFALKNKTSIAFMIHDSYTVYFNKENWKEVHEISERILLCESSFCPDLKLKVSCRVGRNLNELKNFKTKESLDVGNMQQV